MSSLSSTTAVIVTFNRSAKLMKVLDALAAQIVKPDVILVVDNASTDNTRELVEARGADIPELRYMRLDKNLGGAGGFHAGMKAAYEQGANYLWISDDDAYPAPDALQKLLQGITTFEADTGWRPSFACSRVEWVDGALCEMNVPQPVWDWARYLFPHKAWPLVQSCSFVSCLVPRWAVAKHGLPIADYFIWFDDAEYTRRLSDSYPGIYIPESVVTHDTPDNKGVNYALVNANSLWKFKYGARNEASFRRREGGFPSWAAFAYKVHGEMKSGNVPKGIRRKIYRALWNGWNFRPEIPRV